MKENEKTILEKQKEKSFSENLELLKRIIELKKRVQKTMNLKGEN